MSNTRYAIEFTELLGATYRAAVEYTEIAVAFGALRYYAREIARHGQVVESGRRAIVTAAKLVATDGSVVRVPAEVVDAELRGTLSDLIFARLNPAAVSA